MLLLLILVVTVVVVTCLAAAPCRVTDAALLRKPLLMPCCALLMMMRCKLPVLLLKGVLITIDVLLMPSGDACLLDAVDACCYLPACRLPAGEQNRLLMQQRFVITAFVRCSSNCGYVIVMIRALF